MKTLLFKLSLTLALSLPAVRTFGQGTFQNLDFENGTFIPIPGDPFGRVQFGPAMPGWTGYVGTNQVNWILHNNQFLSTAGIAIFGPDLPPGEFNGRYYIVLQAGDDPFGGPNRVNSAIAQTGTIPSDAQSMRLYLASGVLLFSFAGQPIPLANLGPGGGASFNYNIYGADVSAYAGQTGLLELRGGGYLDFIQFSNQPIPEPSAFGLFTFGALLLGWLLCKRL
jgi:hypothetical protein